MLDEQDLKAIQQMIIGAVAPINERLDKIEARLDNVETRLDKIEARLDNVEARLDRLEDDVAIIKSDVKFLKNNVGFNRKTSIDIVDYVENRFDSRFNRMQQQIDALAAKVS